MASNSEKRPLLLDLFCGAGGAAMGYHRAGFDILGVDIAPQKRYPFAFIQADALEFLARLIQSGDIRQFAAIHASPPCQSYSRARHIQRRDHPRLLEPTRATLQATGLPWVIENVADAPMGHYLTLCGTMFGLHVYRHRQFECDPLVFAPSRCSHPHQLLPGYVCVYGHHTRGAQRGNRGNHYTRYDVEVGRAAMGIHWMTGKELSQAIPPAYTQWIGLQLLAVVDNERVA